MKSFRAFFFRLSGWFRKRNREQEMMDEFESHLQMHIADNIRSGMSAEEARRQALLKFGGMESAKESVRDRSRLRGLETAWQDFRYALRTLRRNPGFAVTAIASLALGIGASIAIFTVADNLLLRPLPYPNSSQLVMVWEANQRGTTNQNEVSPANYFDWKTQNTCFSDIAAFLDYHVIFSTGARAEEIDIQSASANLLPMLGVTPIRGRLFTKAEDEASSNGADVAVISYHLWQSWFGGDESAIGRRVQINSRPWTIIGVLPPGFYFHSRTVDAWLPIGLKPAEDFRKTQGRWIWTAARLKPDISLRQAQTQMDTIARRLEDSYPEFNKGWGVNVEPLRDALVGQVKTPLLVLLGAVTLLLGVACANVANLLLTRFNARRREMAVRGALGAARARLVRQLLTESIALGITGGIAGILLARWAVQALLALAPRELTHSVQVFFDLRIVIFALALSLLTGIIFGLAPALVSARSDLNTALHDETRSSTGMGRRLRGWLVAAEVACAVMLLSGAGLLFHTVMKLQVVDPGLNASNVLTFRVTLPNPRYPRVRNRAQFFVRAAQDLAHLPGVTSASAVSYLPLQGEGAATTVAIEGQPPARPGEELIATIRTVLPEYFRTMGIPLRRGRDFTIADDDPDQPYRFIVSESFVRKYLAGREPLGTRINAEMDDKNPFGEIIGVVGDVKEESLDKDPDPTVYYVHAHLAYGGMIFVLRTENDPLSLAVPARKVIQGIDSQQPVADVFTMQKVVRETFARQQFSATLLAGFSFASLLLAAVGIYGVLAYSVAQRTREIGVRVALGAEPSRILRLVVGNGMRLVLIGSLIGLAAAFALSGLLKSMLFGIGPRDPWTFTIAPLVLICVALIAAYVPARRASRLAPMEALRTE
ncbi:MAG TPA: ABC transporter permease [Candidatus Angelobacter sp.]